MRKTRSSNNFKIQLLNFHHALSSTAEFQRGMRSWSQIFTERLKRFKGSTKFSKSVTLSLETIRTEYLKLRVKVDHLKVNLQECGRDLRARLVYEMMLKSVITNMRSSLEKSKM